MSDVAKLIEWMRDRADESEKGAAFSEEDEPELAADMLEDVAKFREVADALEALRGALTHLGNPNYSARASGADAHDMAAFARSELRKLGGDG